MPRAARFAPGGIVYHVLNRAVGRSGIFDDEGDYLAFDKVLAEAVQKHRMRLLAHCLMPNHFHLVLWPALDGDLSIFTRWLSTTHVRRWHQHRHTWGRGHVYQGRFKSFPVQTDEHLLGVCRYVERNALRARLVERAEDWPSCSLGQRGRQQEEPKLSDWPVERPTDWLWWVNEPKTDKELAPGAGMRGAWEAVWSEAVADADGAAAGLGVHLQAAWPVAAPASDEGDEP